MPNHSKVSRKNFFIVNQETNRSLVMFVIIYMHPKLKVCIKVYYIYTVTLRFYTLCGKVKHLIILINI